MNAAGKQRIEWVDMIKGIAILWLIIYHFYVFDWLISPVPIFFFVSGLFYSEGKSFRMFIVRKTKALLIPFVFFYIIGIVPVIVNNVFQGHSYDFCRLLHFFMLIPKTDPIANPLGVGAIWFLLSLFEIYIIFYLIRRVSKASYVVFGISVLLLIIAAFFSDCFAMGSFFYLFYSCGFFIYFALGFLMRDFFIGNMPNGKKYDNKHRLQILLFSILAMSSALLPLEGIVSFVRDRLFCLGLIFILILFVKNADRVLRNCRFRSLLIYQGENSLTILGTHLVIMGGG